MSHTNIKRHTTLNGVPKLTGVLSHAHMSKLEMNPELDTTKYHQAKLLGGLQNHQDGA